MSNNPSPAQREKELTPAADVEAMYRYYTGDDTTAVRDVGNDVLRLLALVRTLIPKIPQWQPIATAPKDGTVILGLCVHDTGAECCPEEGLCVYHYYADATGHCEDGPHVIEYGGGDDDYDEFRGVWYHTPDSWFVTGTDMECAANPTHWMPIPDSQNV